MGVLFDKRIGVAHGDGQTHPGHHRQINQFIANISDLVGGQPQADQQTIERRQLVLDAQIGVVDAQIGHAPFDRGGLATGNDGDFHPGFEQHLDAVAIADVEGLVFVAIVAQIQAAIGQYAVHIEDDQLNLGRLAEYIAHHGPRTGEGITARRRAADRACSAHRPVSHRSLPPAGR